MHVVCVAGTRPNLVKLASQGVLYPRMRSSNLGHFGAAMSMFTGIAEQRGIRENQRADQYPPGHRPEESGGTGCVG